MANAVSRNTTKKLDRRAKIVEIARQRFRSTGLAETTLDMIAEAAELARPNLYRYFKNKAELVSAVLVEEARAINEYRLNKLAGIEDFGERVVTSLQATVEVKSVDRLWGDIVSPGNVPYTAYVASHDQNVLQSNYDFWTPILEQAAQSGELADGLDREAVMKWLLGLEFMFMERSEIFPGPDDVGHYARTFVLPALTR